MIIPVRCFTCNNNLSNKYKLYRSYTNMEYANILTNDIINEIKNAEKVKYFDILIAEYLNEENEKKKQINKICLINELKYKIESISEEIKDVDINKIDKLNNIDDYNIKYYKDFLNTIDNLKENKKKFDETLIKYKKIKSNSGIILDKLGLNRYCCRRCFISCVELVNII